jgi:tRNA (guanine37-N1)-methyltransferase
MKRFHIITLFPEVITPYVTASILGRAQEKKHIKIIPVQLRTYATDRHHTVDDSPYGGGPGMVLKIEPIYRAVQAICSKAKKRRVRTILFSTRGKVFTQSIARRLTRYDDLIFICGRYEGVDERVAEHIADEEISMGDFVLAGGELPALTVIEAVSRQIPGVLGKYESLEEEKGSYPTYTRPAIFAFKKGKRNTSWKVPEELIAGNHKQIEEWRKRI